MLKEMLFTLDLAVDTGTDADRAAADRLQRKCGPTSALRPPPHPTPDPDCECAHDPSAFALLLCIRQLFQIVTF